MIAKIKLDLRDTVCNIVVGLIDDIASSVLETTETLFFGAMDYVDRMESDIKYHHLTITIGQVVLYVLTTK